MKTKRAKPGKARAFVAAAVAFEGEDCLLWPYGCDRKGYGRFNQNGKMRFSHRAVCESVHGPAPSPEHEAAHNCGYPRCINPAHLRWVTPAENSADCLIHGTRLRGERHGMAKLTEAEAREIRSLRGRLSQRELAAQFRVSRTTICYIQTGQNWSWLT